MRTEKEREKGTKTETEMRIGDRELGMTEGEFQLTRTTGHVPRTKRERAESLRPLVLCSRPTDLGSLQIWEGKIKSIEAPLDFVPWVRCIG